MKKRKTLDKAEARKRRDQLIETAASAELSLTEGVREMRAISGMTQEEFARHRGVSARAVKGLELGQGNPTVATLNRIGEFFGLEVAFVPIRRSGASTDHRSAGTDYLELKKTDLLGDRLKSVEVLSQQLTKFEAWVRQLTKAADLAEQIKKAEALNERLKEFETLGAQLEKAGLLQDQRKK